MTTIQDDARQLAATLAKHGSLTLKDMRSHSNIVGERRDLALTFLERMKIVRRVRPLEGIHGVSRTTLVRVDKALASRFAAGTARGTA